MGCNSCHRDAGGGLVCSGCGAIQPPRADADKFAQLGLPRRYDVAPTEIETQYRDLSRRLHPDRFAKAEARQRMLSLQAATALNDAYRRLRDPVKRAEYLLELEGAKIGENDAVDPSFLVEIMELREALADAKLEGDDAALAKLAADVRARHEGTLAAVASGFAAFERERDRAVLKDIRDHLVALRYFQRFLDELEAGREEI